MPVWVFGIVAAIITLGIVLALYGRGLQTNDRPGFIIIGTGTAVIGLILLVVVTFMAFTPRYNLWRAEIEKRILVEDAIARRDSAIELAAAEVNRARGVAESNEIISASIDEQYLRYLFVLGISENDDQQIIYVPTEANLPILEADRLIANQGD